MLFQSDITVNRKLQNFRIFVRTIFTCGCNFYSIPLSAFNMSENIHQQADEKSLVNAVIAKKEHAYRILISRYEKLVIHIVFKMIDHQHDREDLCQDIFLKVFNKISSFRFQSKLSTWIGNIAFNTCLNFLKRKKAFLVEDFYITGEENNYKSPQHFIDSNKLPDNILLTKEKDMTKEN